MPNAQFRDTQALRERWFGGDYAGCGNRVFWAEWVRSFAVGAAQDDSELSVGR
jgi:hypothetical protein